VLRAKSPPFQHWEIPLLLLPSAERRTKQQSKHGEEKKLFCLEQQHTFRSRKSSRMLGSKLRAVEH